jgi:hypothetical protein
LFLKGLVEIEGRNMASFAEDFPQSLFLHSDPQLSPSADTLRKQQPEWKGGI